MEGRTEEAGDYHMTVTRLNLYLLPGVLAYPALPLSPQVYIYRLLSVSSHYVHTHSCVHTAI